MKDGDIFDLATYFIKQAEENLLKFQRFKITLDELVQSADKVNPETFCLGLKGEDNVQKNQLIDQAKHLYDQINFYQHNNCWKLLAEKSCWLNVDTFIYRCEQFMRSKEPDNIIEEYDSLIVQGELLLKYLNCTNKQNTIVDLYCRIYGIAQNSIGWHCIEALIKVWYPLVLAPVSEISRTNDVNLYLEAIKENAEKKLEKNINELMKKIVDAKKNGTLFTCYDDLVTLVEFTEKYDGLVDLLEFTEKKRKPEKKESTKNLKALVEDIVVLISKSVDKYILTKQQAHFWAYIKTQFDGETFLFDLSDRLINYEAHLYKLKKAESSEQCSFLGPDIQFSLSNLQIDLKKPWLLCKALGDIQEKVFCRASDVLKIEQDMDRAVTLKENIKQIIDTCIIKYNRKKCIDMIEDQFKEKAENMLASIKSSISKDSLNEVQEKNLTALNDYFLKSGVSSKLLSDNYESIQKELTTKRERLIYIKDQVKTGNHKYFKLFDYRFEINSTCNELREKLPAFKDNDISELSAKALCDASKKIKPLVVNAAIKDLPSSRSLNWKILSERNPTNQTIKMIKEKMQERKIKLTNLKQSINVNYQKFIKMGVGLTLCKKMPNGVSDLYQLLNKKDLNTLDPYETIELYRKVNAIIAQRVKKCSCTPCFCKNPILRDKEVQALYEAPFEKGRLIN